jgi:hypothetical protein
MANKEVCPTWEVYAPEGPYPIHPKTGHPASYSICKLSKDGEHKECLALVFGKTDKQAAKRAKAIATKVKGIL